MFLTYIYSQEKGHSKALKMVVNMVLWKIAEEILTTHMFDFVNKMNSTLIPILVQKTQFKINFANEENQRKISAADW